ncbi:hypothetical protein [Streptomyces sp. NPDC090298]|uniref:hypothetical protein n=1 Tax=Streptomyces sp. NPDC090298 TaxID=3365959 RepID=UPI0038160407
MHGTRTTAKILVGAAVAALAGCVSVDAPPSAPTPSPAPAAGVAGPARDVAPQIVEGPAREALEAALPTRPPSTPPRVAPPSGQPRRAAAPPRAQNLHPTSAPERGERARPAARPDLSGLPQLTGPTHDPSVTDVDVCDLGERYGGWAPGSDQARICQGAYGR